MKILFLFFCIGQIWSGVSQTNNYLFSDIVVLTAIQKIEITNNKGIHTVSKEKFEKIKKELGKMTPGSNAIKVGMKQIHIWIKNKRYVLSGATHGSIIEVPAAIATKNKQLFGNQNTLYFNTNGLNIDNY